MPVAVVPPALLDDPSVGVSATLMAVSLDPGTGLSDLRSELDTLRGGADLSLEPAVLVDPSVRRAIEAQSQGLGLLALVAAAAALVVLGQMAVRQARRSDAERTQLSALGFTRQQMLAESLGWVVVALLGGVLLGAGLATLASVAFPSGFVRPVEPDPGLRVEAGVLVVGVPILVLGPALWCTAVLVLGPRVRRRPTPSAVVERMASWSGPATAATGLRFALARTGRDEGSPRSGLLGLAAVAAVLVGTLVFGSSLGRLVSEPARSGSVYDLRIGDDGASALPPQVRQELDADPDVTGLMLYAAGQARVGGSTIGLVGMEPVKGELAPPVLAGRLPASADEIALGRLEAHDLGVGIGDEVALEDAGRIQRARVTGLAVVPNVAGVDGVGQDGIVTLAGLRRLDPSIESVAASIGVGPDAPPGTIGRLARAEGGDQGGPSLPETMTNVVRVRTIPYLLAALLVGLTVLTVLHLMLVSVRNRRRDAATLRAIGADHHWTARVLHWQVSVIVLLPLALGAPAGVVAGTAAFRAFADSIGTVDDASIPYRWVAALVAILLVLANLVARVGARRARELPVAAALNPE